MLTRIFAFGLILWVAASIYYNRLTTSGTIVVLVIFVMAGLGNMLFGSSNDRKAIAEQLRMKKLVPDLKANGEKIIVDFRVCKIHTRDYTKGIGLDPYAQYSWGVALPTIGGPGNLVQSVILFKRKNPQTRKIERFVSPIIPQNKKTLSDILDRHRQTTLYVDKTDPSQYFFDLDFLTNS